jgi:hypothetical protein
MVLIIFGMLLASAMADITQIRHFPQVSELKINVSDIKFEMIKLQVEAQYDIVIKNHYSFLHDIGFRESTNNYKAVNKFGYLGKYQFGRKTLNAIGFKEITNRQFLSEPKIQEEAMLILLKKNKRTLRREIRKYVGKTISGIYITESGILAAAHLGGAGSVRKFFRNGKDFKDGLGTPITSYMALFSGYNLNI